MHFLGAKILTAVAIAALLLIPGGQALVGGTSGNLFAAMTATGAPAWQTYLAYSAAMLSLNLATTGIQQLMAPDPSVDEKDDPGYMISGVSQNVVEGDPIPLLYGELRVPSKTLPNLRLIKLLPMELNLTLDMQLILQTVNESHFEVNKQMYRQSL